MNSQKQRDDNKIKSQHGNNFNKKIELILKEALSNNTIKSFIKEPKYYMPAYGTNQFQPDFEIKLNNEQIITIDNSTSLRSDRVKQKQWDALGIKSFYMDQDINVKCLIVIDSDNMGIDDYKSLMSLRDKILAPNYFSMIDNIITSDDLLDIVSDETQLN